MKLHLKSLKWDSALNRHQPWVRAGNKSRGTTSRQRVALEWLQWNLLQRRINELPEIHQKRLPGSAIYFLFYFFFLYTFVCFFIFFFIPLHLDYLWTNGEYIYVVGIFTFLCWNNFFLLFLSNPQTSTTKSIFELKFPWDFTGQL